METVDGLNRKVLPNILLIQLLEIIIIYQEYSKQQGGEGVETLSIWAFSTENWEREKREVDELLGVIERGIDSFYLASQRDKYQFRFIGRTDRLPRKMESKILELEEE